MPIDDQQGQAVERAQSDLNSARFQGIGGRFGFIRVVRTLPLRGTKDELLVLSKPGDAAHGTMYWWDDNAKAWTPIATPNVAANHNILSTTHPDSLAASVVRGDVLIGNSTPAWARTALGPSGQYLRSDGTDLLYSAILDADLPATIARDSELHTRYTDAEAVAAVEAKDPLNLAGNVFIANLKGLVVGHTAQIDFGAIPEFQVLGTGTPDSSMGFARFENIAAGPDVRFLKSRGATIGTNTIVQDGDTLGRFRFQGADSGDFNTTAAEVSAEVDGPPALTNIPGRLIFTTRISGGALAEKMRLDNAGRLGIGTNNPQELFHAAGNMRLDAFYFDIDDIAAPANPAAGFRRLFVDTATGELSVRTSGGSIVSLEGGGGGGAPTTAPYITYGSDAGLSAEISPKSTDLVGDFGGADLHWRFADIMATRRFIVEHTNIGKVSIDVINPTVLVGPYNILHGFFGAEANPRIRLNLPLVGGEPALDFGPGSAAPDVRLERFTTNSFRIATTGGSQAGLAFNSSGGDLAAPPSGHVVNYAKSFAGQARAFYRGSDGLTFGPLGTPAATIIFQRGQKGEWCAPADTAANFAAGGWGLLANLQRIGGTPTMGDGNDGHFISVPSGPVAGNDGGFYTNAVCVRADVLPGLRGPAFQVKFRLPTITSVRMFIGLSTQSLATMVGADNPVGDYVGLQFSTPRGDTNWQAVSKDNTTQDLQDSGIAAATTVFTIRVEFNGVSFLWTLLSATYTVLASGIFSLNGPRTAQDMRFIVGFETETAATRSIEHFWSGLLAPNI